MGLSLAAIVGLAVGFLYLMRRIVPLPRGGRSMRIIESVSLEPRRAIHLVKVGNRHILIGSTEGGISRIAELPEGELDIEEEVAPRGPRFLDLLRGRTRRTDGKD